MSRTIRHLNGLTTFGGRRAVMLEVGCFDHQPVAVRSIRTSDRSRGPQRGLPCRPLRSGPSCSWEELHMKFGLALGLTLGVLGVAAVSAADSTESGPLELPTIKIV